MSDHAISTAAYLLARQPGPLRPRETVVEESPAPRRVNFRSGLRVKLETDDGEERSAIARWSRGHAASFTVAA
jgi:hypothetical protein